MNTNSAHVSIVIPLYNSSATIASTLDSVLAQTYSNWTAILVDDGSSDNTQEILESYFQDSRVSYFKQSNQGIAGARNTGIEAAKGDWLCLLDHDDRWLPTKLARQLDFAASNKLDIICTDATVVQGESHTLYSEVFPSHLVRDLERSLDDASVDPFELLIKGNFICASSVMIRRSYFDRFGLLDPEVAPADDYDMWLRCGLQARIGFLSQPLIEYHLHERNYSHDRLRMAQKEIYALRKSRTSAHDADRKYLRLLDERISQLRRETARVCLDRFHEAAQRGERSEAILRFRTALELSPYEVLQPRRLLAAFKRGMVMMSAGSKG